MTVTAAAEQLGWAFFGPVIDTTRAVLAARTAAERTVIDQFLDDLVAALQPAGGAAPEPPSS